MAAAVCIAVTDADAQLIVVMSATGGAPRLISKYRPFVPQVVVTHQPQVQRAATVSFGQYGILVPVLDDAQALALQAMDWASEKVGRCLTAHAPQRVCNQGAPAAIIAVGVQ